MISGIGIDLVEKARIDDLLERYGQQFVRRVLNADEREAFARSTRKGWFLANRFAAKEAIAKALGTGLRFPVTLHSVGIISNDLGQPGFRFSETLNTYLETRNIGGAHLSITHEKGLVCAVVVLESLP